MNSLLIMLVKKATLNKRAVVIFKENKSISISGNPLFYPDLSLILLFIMHRLSLSLCSSCFGAFQLAAS